MSKQVFLVVPQLVLLRIFVQQTVDKVELLIEELSVEGCRFAHSDDIHKSVASPQHEGVVVVRIKRQNVRGEMEDPFGLRFLFVEGMA